MTSTPGSVQPPHNGLVLTDYPELRALVKYTVGGIPEDVVVTWQISPDQLFDTDLQSVTTDRVWRSGQVARMPIAQPLSAGEWWIRARATKVSDSSNSLWTTAQKFTVDHKPFPSNMTPAQGDRVAYGTGTIRFGWRFSDGDPSDVQTAYQIQAFHAATDVLAFDTGKQVSGGEFHDQVFAPGDSAGFFYWRMKVWDRYDIESGWSDALLFQVGNEPVATVIFPPSGSTVDVPNPTVQWAFSTGNAPPITYTDIANQYATYAEIDSENDSYLDLTVGSPEQADQTHFRIMVKQGQAVVHDSDWIAGTASAYQLPAIIHQGEPYDLTVSVRDEGNFEGSSTPVRFTGSWPAPDVPEAIVVDVSAVDDPFVGAVQIKWNAELYDPTFVEWRVYSRIKGTTVWELVGTSDVTTGEGEILDDLFESGRTYEYAVSQVARRYFNEIAESFMGVVEATPLSTKYWLIHGSDRTFNLMLSHVVADSYEEEYEEYVQEIKGRGRRQEVGTRYGFKGSLTLHVRGYDPRGSKLELAQIEAFKAGRLQAYLRVPFGRIWKVGVSNISVSRLSGTGLNEYADVTIPYFEVI